MVLVSGIVKTVHEYCYWYWELLRTHHKIGIGIVKASLKILGIGIGVKKVVLHMSALQCFKRDRGLLFGTFQAACVGLY